MHLVIAKAQFLASLIPLYIIITMPTPARMLHLVASVSTAAIVLLIKKTASIMKDNWNSHVYKHIITFIAIIS